MRVKAGHAWPTSSRALLGFGRTRPQFRRTQTRFGRGPPHIWPSPSQAWPNPSRHLVELCPELAETALHLVDRPDSAEHVPNLPNVGHVELKSCQSVEIRWRPGPNLPESSIRVEHGPTLTESQILTIFGPDLTTLGQIWQDFEGQVSNATGKIKMSQVILGIGESAVEGRVKSPVFWSKHSYGRVTGLTSDKKEEQSYTLDGKVKWIYREEHGAPMGCVEVFRKPSRIHQKVTEVDLNDKECRDGQLEGSWQATLAASEAKFKRLKTEAGGQRLEIVASSSKKLNSNSDSSVDRFAATRPTRFGECQSSASDDGDSDSPKPKNKSKSGQRKGLGSAPRVARKAAIEGGEGLEIEGRTLKVKAAAGPRLGGGCVEAVGRLCGADDMGAADLGTPAGRSGYTRRAFQSSVRQSRNQVSALCPTRAATSEPRGPANIGPNSIVSVRPDLDQIWARGGGTIIVLDID